MCHDAKPHLLRPPCRVLLQYIQPDDGYVDWPLHWTFPQLSTLRQVALCTLHSMAPSFPEVRLYPFVPLSAPFPSLTMHCLPTDLHACLTCDCPFRGSSGWERNRELSVKGVDESASNSIW